MVTKRRFRPKQEAFNDEPLTLTWRVPRQIPVEHPRSTDEFKQWPQERLNEAAFTYRNYLDMCDDRLKHQWLDNWQQVYAVGPFIGRRRSGNSIPFVIVAHYRSPYRHLLTLSDVLSEAYLEFGILPDLHILQTSIADKLEEAENPRWDRTKSASIKWDR